MIFVGPLLMGLGGQYIGRHIDGANAGILAVFGFAIGIVWLAQAPTIALRRRVLELETRLVGNSSVGNK
jgi:hypothetical protein